MTTLNLRPKSDVRTLHRLMSGHADHAGVAREPSRTERAAWFSCLCSAAALASLLWATRSRVEMTSLLLMGGLMAVLVLLHIVYTRLRPDALLGALAGGLTVLTWAGLMSGLIALVGLRADAPLIDAGLADADNRLGLDTQAFVAWTAEQATLGRVLDLIYSSAVPLVFAIATLLAVTRRPARMWRLCLAFSVCGTVCAAASVVVPAVGAFTFYQTPPALLARLPSGAGLFYVPVFEAYRSGALDAIDLRRLDGVVTFPSFHACMALMIGDALSGRRWLSGVAWLWSGAILISTVPIGGHYAIDVIAGAGTWAACALWCRHIEARPRRRAGLLADRPTAPPEASGYRPSGSSSL